MKNCFHDVRLLITGGDFYGRKYRGGNTQLSMQWLLSTLVSGFVAFTLTDIDDLLLLIFFFSQTKKSFTKREVFLGQYLGFLVLLLLTTLGYLGTLVIPQAWIGLLGLIPFIRGLNELHKRYFNKKEPSSDQKDTSSSTVFSSRLDRVFARLFNPRVSTIAVLTIGNGSDNLSVYIPLFAHSTPGQVGIYLILFLFLVGVWCILGYTISHLPGIAQVLERTVSFILPFLMIGLGLFILWKNGTFLMLFQLVTRH
jgi:cadmium resistance transport/sequestration family protein